MVITVYSVTLTWTRVVLGLRVHIVETGFVLVYSEERLMNQAIFMRFMDLRELTYVVGTIVTCHLVYIVVTLQLMLSMMIMTENQSMWDSIIPMIVSIARPANNV